MKFQWKIKSAIIFTSIIFCLINFNRAVAAEDPVKMLENITERVIIKLKNNTQTLKYNPGEIYEFMDDLVLPHVDFIEMGRWIVGRNAWHEADNVTREKFIKVFKKFVVKNYTQLLLKWTNEEIAFLPLRENIGSKKNIQISSLIKRSGRSHIRMDYHLILQDNAWKVYDIMIEGVSLLEGYQEQFSNDIKEGGVAAVIERMRRRR